MPAPVDVSVAVARIGTTTRWAACGRLVATASNTSHDHHHDLTQTRADRQVDVAA